MRGFHPNGILIQATLPTLFLGNIRTLNMIYSVASNLKATITSFQTKTPPHKVRIRRCLKTEDVERFPLLGISLRGQFSRYTRGKGRIQQFLLNWHRWHFFFCKLGRGKRSLHVLCLSGGRCQRGGRSWREARRKRNKAFRGRGLGSKLAPQSLQERGAPFSPQRKDGAVFREGSGDSRVGALNRKSNDCRSPWNWGTGSGTHLEASEKRAKPWEVALLFAFQIKRQ